MKSRPSDQTIAQIKSAQLIFEKAKEDLHDRKWRSAIHKFEQAKSLCETHADIVYPPL